MSTENFDAKLYQAAVMLLSGRPPKPVDVLLLHNRSFEDDTDLLEMAGAMFRRGSVRFIAVTNNEGERVGSKVPFEANPGRSYYEERLKKIGVPRSRISIPRTRAFHTRQENTAFIRQTRYRNWTSGAILAQPHQLLRTMLGAVQAMSMEGYQIELYTIGPQHTSWLKTVKGSQGEEEKSREDHVREEFNRILKYQASGNLATFSELFAYLEARERGSLILGPIRGSERFKLL